MLLDINGILFEEFFEHLLYTRSDTVLHFRNGALGFAACLDGLLLEGVAVGIAQGAGGFRGRRLGAW
jgi:hypothetical protein